jgi:hypothetical protein
MRKTKHKPLKLNTAIRGVEQTILLFTLLENWDMVTPNGVLSVFKQTAS